MKNGFDCDKYVALQSEKIKERIKKFGGKLYLEFGGKLFDDHHASRVLPGFAPDSKIKMLKEFGSDAEVIIAINANDIEKNKVRGDYGITYDLDVLRLIDAFRVINMDVAGVVITQFYDQPLAISFMKRLDDLGIRSFKHYVIPDYPSNVENIVSENGYGKNEYVPTTKSLVVVTAPGPGSGKMEVCLTQLYHDNKNSVKSGYAKFETFPIWNLPLDHPVNIAYEAATADLNDINMIDPFHLSAYNETTVNYNRDIEVFPVLKNMIDKIMGENIYKSPTDMGVNMAGFCITDEEVIRDACKQEILRRYYKALCDFKKGTSNGKDIYKLELLLQKMDVTSDDRPCIKACLDKASETKLNAVAITLEDGTTVTGKTSSLLGASSAALLNALKYLANIDDEITLISPSIIEPIQHLKVDNLGNSNPRLHTDEILIALSICAVTDEKAKSALGAISKLRNAQMHSSTILSPVDESTLSKLGIQITMEPVYDTKKLYHKNK